MNLAILRFHSTLWDFFPPERRNVPLEVRFKENPSVKNLFESVGVPHVEVNRILVNQAKVNFVYLVQDGDQIDLYPALKRVPASDRQPEQEFRFVLDNHLGKLSRYLRLLGFDSRYRNDFQDEELAHVSAEEDRILLTRDRRLLMRSIVRLGYWVRETDPHKQTVEILGRFGLEALIRPFQRCIRCNGLLFPVEKERVLDRLEALTQQYYEQFQQCENCGQVYWAGSHYSKVLKLIQKFLGANRSSYEI